ncbi:filamentous hemagglutinin N-terminal domain-containing protein [Dechloromonas denitrificans]|uniref:filamentous hemagglutinin N-terminal domain-containing protein n=1 Tax=Dechloromonas denitrificans TaxID=281362 RepID=UPI001CFBB663|nr:filamentous hemagglutinin N-terminal domain-containing protein [Dechloromonas denitrificans]UCV09793.1 filamentous hemagglutinin N-terminal domain-containing protein [Dechloromonas denitrificans]
MNREVYRLIFNHERNAFVAVAEHVRGRGKKTTRRRAAAVLLGLAAVTAGSGGQAIAAPPPANALPVPASGSMPFVYRGTVTGGQPITVGNAMTINTDSRMLGLNWQSFNIGSSASVTFNQPDATSRVLNRIWSNDPSQIMGKLSANGQIYLINQNGILFGNGAQVNVGGLVASSLNLSESMASQLLNNGLPSAKGDKLEFAFDGSAAGFESGFVTVEAGARISTPSGGKVVLIAPKTVENLGLIESGGGGEAILAAGGKVILTAPSDPNLRGLLVETQSFVGKDALGNKVTLDGSVSNKADGSANNGRIDMGNGGVVSLAALAVNQKGIVNASKAVNLNGTTMLVSGNIETDRLTVNQRGDVAQIDWVSGFNVAVGKTVEFVQSSPGAVAYNYVFDPDRTAADGTILNVAGRSSINGILKASGQFFLINEKGISFGANARVSASNFVASALGMNSSIVTTGLLGQSAVNQRAFFLNKTPATYDETDPNRQQVFDQAMAAFRAATIDVQAGATITSGNSGYVILAGSKVAQGGAVTTPGGQTVLAAGADLYLKPGFASAARGFSAEVNPLYVVRTRKYDDQGLAVDDSNKVWLALSRGADANTVINSGTITASFGDITLVGHEITQAGILRASTSTSANGSIHLLARDQLNTQGDGEPTVPGVFWRKYNENGVIASTGTSVSSTATDVSQFVSGLVGGKLTFAADSKTVIDIDSNASKTLTADQTFVQSSIDGLARQVVVEDADIVAKGGNIRLRASEQFGEFTAFANDPVSPLKSAKPPADVGIFVSDGAHLDASGENVSKSVADLFIKVELRGDEFADNPIQRNGNLRGKTAWVDSRDAVSIANLSGYKIGLTAKERAAAGGSISLGSTGSVIVKESAVLDVSGGKVDYAAGAVTESYALTYGGQRYRLNDAPSDARYALLVSTTRQEAAYVEGKSAGKVELLGQSLAVDGNLLAKTTVGTRQRELGDPSANRYAVPLGGQLIIKDSGQHYPLADRDAATEAEKIAAYTKAQITFVKGAAKAAAGLAAGDAAGPQLELSENLVGNGFSRFDITSDGRIDVPAEISLNLAPGGSFKASGRQVYVAGDISAPGGSIALTTNDMSTAAGDFPLATDARFSTLIVDAGASLSTAGRWINDFLDGKLSNSAKAIDGGSIELKSAYDLDVRAGSSVDVSGGGRVKSDGSLAAGNAGSIALETGGVSSSGFDFTGDLDRRDASLFLGGTLSGYALGKGGTLTVKTSAIRFGETFKQDSRDWSRAERLAANQVGAAFDAGFVDRGGFFNFNFVGRDGLVVADGVKLSADPVSWSLLQAGAYRYRATGSSLTDFARSLVLHPELRSAPTKLSLATASPVYGDLLVGENAYVGVSPQGSIKLESAGQMTVLGTLEAPAGTITLSRPVKYDYSEEKQSESIYLGANSRLLASGRTVLDVATRQAIEAGMSAGQLLSQYRYKGQVLNGGTVSIDAGLGYLVTRNGSVIDVSGVTDTLNVPTSKGSGVVYAARTVGSAGGTVNFAARDGMFLDGSYLASGGKDALGGVFALRFADAASAENPWNIVIPVNPVTGKADKSLLPADERAVVADRQLMLYQSSGAHADSWTADEKATQQYLDGQEGIDPATYNGKAALDLARLVGGGFGSWYLSSQNEMRFAGTIAATVNNQLQLNAPTFSAADGATNVALKAAALQLGNFNANAGVAAASAGIGNATARFDALDIGLIGTFSWNGFGSSTFASRGEIHFDSLGNTVAQHTGGRLYNGQMTASGDLIFSAARLSPATYSDFRIDLLADPNGSIAIDRLAGSWADVSNSPAGRLEFAARDISHDGTVTAPLGEIVFSAPGGKVTLGAGSITSVAADRDMLFGNTAESGSSWNYLGNKVESLPAKNIRIDAADSVVTSGARLDLSGGGEALAWEFTAGPGGKNDVLAAASGVFAIVPGWNGISATDGQLQQGYLGTTAGGISSLKVGDLVSLGANRAGLSGSFVLLPARYAVLPGAYLVSVKSADNSVLGGAKQQADGSWLVSGSRLALNADGSTTAYSPSPLTLELASSSVVAKRANYTTTTASEFFYDQAGANLAGDAGRLTVIGRNTLSFDPVVVAMRQAEIAAADGRKRAGRGLEIDLAAPKLLVSDNKAAPDASWSRLNQDKLNALGASSLLLGGTRTVDGDLTRIETIATDVVVSNSGKALSGPELMLTARDNLTVTTDSRIESVGNAEARNIVLSGDGAFLRVAEGGQASLSREGGVNRTQGNLDIQKDATVAGRSLIFDATRDNALNGNILLGVRQSDGSRSRGGSLAIGAKRINVVGDGSVPGDGLTLDNDDLLRFVAADQLRLTSYTTLDLYGSAKLGASTLKELVIAAAGIAGHGKDASATIRAQSVSFENPNPASASFTAGAALGEGKLTVEAPNITFGGNAPDAMRAAETAGFGMRGFKTVDLVASGDLRFSGTGVTAIDNVGGSGNAADLNINVGRVVTVGAAKQLLVASGATTVSRNAKASEIVSDNGLGGSLELRAKSMDVSGTIDVAAGKLTLAGRDSLTINTGALVRAEGKKVAFADTYAYAPGGTIKLKSEQGDVTVKSGAMVSVSADAAGGDAGTLELIAQNGSVSAAAATLRGSANSKAQQGVLKVDAKAVELDNLAAAAMDAAGGRQFTGSWDIRRRAGDLALNDLIQAQAVKLAADAGNIKIGGTIDASGNKGGKIELYANRSNSVGGTIDLLAGSQLLANATESVGTGQGTNGQGGTVIVAVSATDAADELGTSINFASASADKEAALIDVSTPIGSSADQGKVIFRAPRQDTVAALKTLQGTALNWSDVLIAPDATGSATAFSLAPATAMASYQVGMVATFKAPAANTGALTLNVSGKGAKSVLRADGSVLQAADVAKDSIIVAVFDGTAFRLQSSGAVDTGSANAYKVAQPAVTASDFKMAGYTLTFRAKTANTTTSTLEIATTDTKKISINLKREDGSALQRNDILANQLVTAVYTITDATAGTGEFRIVRNTELASGPVTGSSMAPVSLAGDVSGAKSIALEGVNTARYSGNVVLGAPQQAVLLARSAQAAAAKGSTFVSNADQNGRLGVVYRAGEEVRATGDITVGNDWSFARARYANQPGTLTLRAEGDLNINGTLSDGFVRNGDISSSVSIPDVFRDARLASSGDSWSYQLVAGADTKQASPLAVRADAAAGSITVGANKLVRTGTGSIDLAAAKDIVLKDRAAVYTAGVASATQPDGFSPINNSGSDTKVIYSTFPTGGGDITMTAGERIVMEKNSSAVYQGHVNEWLMRSAANTTKSLQWWPRIASFQQGVAAFGGGDIALTAGNEIRNAIAAIPTTGRIPQVDGVSQPDDAVISGGGDLLVRTAGAITGGMFYAETGRLLLAAAAINPYQVVNGSTTTDFNTTVAMGNTQASIVSSGDVVLGNVFNPLWTATRYLYNDKYTTTAGAAAKTGLTSNDDFMVRIGTYGANSSVAVTSLAGNVTLQAADTSYGITDSQTHRLMPSQVSVAALNGDISGAVAQVPGDNSQLDLLARGSIHLFEGSITQLDVPASALPSIGNPMMDAGSNGHSSFLLLDLAKQGSTLEKHSTTGWHINDFEPSRLVALSGDITGEKSLTSVADFNEAVLIKAGGDIVNLNLSAQHAHASDISSIVADGDIRYDTYSTSGATGKTDVTSAPLGIQVSGPGAVEVIAGKSIDLADTWGIVTRGNLDNPNLPEGGADILAVAGAKPNYDSLRTYFGLGKEVGDSELRDRFFTLLRDYGRQAQSDGNGAGYEQGRALAKALFPSDQVGKGDIKLSVSQIKSEQGGGIQMLAPGGSVIVGVPDPTLIKKSSAQGIFTIRDGDIMAYVGNSFLVNQSRVFTLDGGDIMIWADRGSIDAGSGAKTVVATPPPVLVIRNGQIVLDTSNSVSGSGIGVLASRDDTPASDMDLFAPNGAIDAGDAGLRSTGRITLGAPTILNASNIQAAGGVSGAPAAATTATPVAAITSPTSAEDRMLEESPTAAGNRNTAQGMLTVEVLGGEECSEAARSKGSDDKSCNPG